MNILEYVQTHWLEITAILAAVLVLAERVAQLTPTDADNKAVAWIGKILSVVALKKQ
jgi:hypothetical protein